MKTRNAGTIARGVAVALLLAACGGGGGAARRAAAARRRRRPGRAARRRVRIVSPRERRGRARLDRAGARGALRRDDRPGHDQGHHADHRAPAPVPGRQAHLDELPGAPDDPERRAGAARAAGRVRGRGPPALRSRGSSRPWRSRSRDEPHGRRRSPSRVARPGRIACSGRPAPSRSRGAALLLLLRPAPAFASLRTPAFLGVAYLVILGGGSARLAPRSRATRPRRRRRGLRPCAWPPDWARSCSRGSWSRRPRRLVPTTVGVGLSVLAAVAEEALFRGGLFRLLERRGIALAVVGSSLAFALIHVPAVRLAGVPGRPRRGSAVLLAAPGHRALVRSRGDARRGQPPGGDAMRTLRTVLAAALVASLLAACTQHRGDDGRRDPRRRDLSAERLAGPGRPGRVPGRADRGRHGERRRAASTGTRSRWSPWTPPPPARPRRPSTCSTGRASGSSSAATAARSRSRPPRRPRGTGCSSGRPAPSA